MHDELYEHFKTVLHVLYKHWLTVLLKRILAYRLQIVIIAFARLLFKGILGWSSFQYFENVQILMCFIYVIYIEPIDSSF